MLYAILAPITLAAIGFALYYKADRDKMRRSCYTSWATMAARARRLAIKAKDKNTYLYESYLAHAVRCDREASKFKEK